MHWTKPLGLLGIAFLAVLAGGALVLLASVVLGDVAALATVALVAVLVVAATVVGLRSRRTGSTPYW